MNMKNKKYIIAFGMVFTVILLMIIDALLSH